MTTDEEEIMTDSEPEINDDEFSENDNKFTNRAPFPDECDDEVKGIESFSACFQERYNSCPVFYPGSLSSACESAFKSEVFEKRRPVLVYIYDDKSMLNNIFCQTIFCSEIIIDYLLENYIVWPWDITFISNKNKLIQMWKKIFSNPLLNIHDTEQCPMLIGIMRRSAKDKYWASKSEYQFKVLLKGDTLMCTQQKSNRERLLNELAIFKEECDRNEQNRSFDFVGKTGLPGELMLEIVKYLSLNDAINAFSESILISLLKYNTKLQICEPSKEFIDLIRRKINLQQIVSLRVKSVSMWPDFEISYLSVFTNVVSLTLLNPRNIDQIKTYTILFPKLNCLSLWYDGEVNFYTLNHILQQSFCQKIRRFEIHCAITPCSHFQCPPYVKNLNVRCFLFYLGHYSLRSMTQCTTQYKSCFLLGIINFIKSMTNVRYVGLITNKYHLDKVSDCNQWKTLLDACPDLKKITIENIIPGEQLVTKAIEIYRTLSTTQ
ncbi:unnamed protein product [Adineta steineri]|uniref:UAS domain-containing protein n=1 Tax=Adineta steineri TaxID=433720 RepID=A0A814YH78_9BILA|nr:unnamed protein product [Adineta steineri]CAF3687972.1 unnamed protein product [Adineta steineri]